MSSRLRPNEAFSGRSRPAFDPGLSTAGNRTTNDRMVDASIQNALQSGKVILQNKGLKEFPKSLFTAGASAEQWWQIEALRVIDLSGNSIAELPEELSSFYETLGTLRVSSNQLRSLPVAALSKLMCLKLLDLSYNNLTLFPRELCLPSIVELNLSGNPMTALPSLGGMAPSLEILRLGSMGLERLPEDVGACAKLLELDISCNALIELPPSIGHCKRLKELKADQNRLRDLGGILEGCSSLVRLDLNQNQLRHAPSLPHTSTLLEVLLSNNQLEALPARSIVRPSITTLDVSTNNLSELPNEMRGCSSLHTLDLRNNNLAVLPSWLGFMANLTRLSVEGNPLRSLRTILSATSAAVGSASASAGGGGTGGAAATQALKEYLRTRATDAEQFAAGNAGDYTSVAAPASLSSSSSGAAGAANSLEIVTTSTCSHEGATGPRGKIPLHVCVVAAQEAWTRSVREAAGAGGRFSAIPYFASAVPGTSAAGTEAAGRILSFSLAALDGGEGIGLLKRLRVLNLDGQGQGQAGQPQGSELQLPVDLLLHCPNLEEVSLASCGLTAIPAALMAAPSAAPLMLQDLNLSRNRLGARPLELSRLPASLGILDLSFNGLKSIPLGLQALTALHTLLLSSNEITLETARGGGGGVGSSPRLGMARPSSAAPSAASASSSAGSMAGTVDDGSSLPSTSLVHLDLASNGMVHLPASIFSLQALQTLDLRQNELQIVPSALAALPSLTGLNIDGNPQRGVRPAVVDKGPAAVLSYLKTRLTDHDVAFVRNAIARATSFPSRDRPSTAVASSDPYGRRAGTQAQAQPHGQGQGYYHEDALGVSGPSSGFAVSRSFGSEFERDRAYRAAMREGEAAAGEYAAYRAPPPQPEWRHADASRAAAARDGVAAPTSPFAMGFDPARVSASVKYQDRYQRAGGTSTNEWDSDTANRAARFSDGLPSSSGALDEAAIRAEAARRFHANTPASNYVVGVPTSESGLYSYASPASGPASGPAPGLMPAPAQQSRAFSARPSSAMPTPSSSAASFARIDGGGMVVGPSVAVMRELPPELGGPGLHEQLAHVREQIKAVEYESCMSTGAFAASLKRKLTVLRAQEHKLMKEMGIDVC